MLSRSELLARLTYDLALSPTHAAIVAKLWAVGNNWISTADLNDATAEASRIYDPDNPRSDRTMSVHIYQIRQKLGDDFVIGHNYHGWTLGAAGVSRIRQIIKAAEAADATNER